MDKNVIMDYEFDTGWVLLFIISVKDGNECYDGLRNWYRLNSIFVSICKQMLRDGYECWFRLQELKDDYKCFDCCSASRLDMNVDLGCWTGWIQWSIMNSIQCYDW